MTILLVDDDEDDRKLFIEATKEVDSTITCFSASDGMEALAYLRDDRNSVPDFIFLDLRMPGFSGEECLIEIKQEPRIAGVPVIVYTTSRDVQESVRLKKLGAAHFAILRASRFPRKKSFIWCLSLLGNDGRPG
jgi:CheY-like chemotaxis protein